jgi:hypothetical protein
MSDSKDQVNVDKFKVKHTMALKVAYAYALIFFGLIFLDPNKLIRRQNSLKGSVAMVVEKSNDVKVKHPKGATWATLKKGDKLYPNSMVFTGAGASVVMLLEDESVIKQGPDSLLRLKIVKKYSNTDTSKEDVKSALRFLKSLDKKLVDEGPFNESDGLDLEIDGGNISVSTTKGSKIKSIKTRDSRLVLDDDSEVTIKNDGSNNTNIAMVSGSGRLQAGAGKLNEIKLNKNESISTKKLKEGDQEYPTKAIKEAKSASNLSSSMGEKYEAKKKSIWETIKKMGRIILFLD